jgi:hypothetical protein
MNLTDCKPTSDIYNMHKVIGSNFGPNVIGKLGAM